LVLSEERLLLYDDSYGRLPELEWLSRSGLSEAAVMRTAGLLKVSQRLSGGNK
jgi:hypothetical protein